MKIHYVRPTQRLHPSCTLPCVCDLLESTSIVLCASVHVPNHAADDDTNRSGWTECRKGSTQCTHARTHTTNKDISTWRRRVCDVYNLSSFSETPGKIETSRILHRRCAFVDLVPQWCNLLLEIKIRLLYIKVRYMITNWPQNIRKKSKVLVSDLTDNTICINSPAYYSKQYLNKCRFKNIILPLELKVFPWERCRILWSSD